MSLEVYPWEKIIEEGKARIIIPDPALFTRSDGKYEPAWAPVFYNPLMRLNRDLTVIIARTMYPGGGFFVEALGGSGVRGVRLGAEAGMEGIINDVDPIAHYYIRRNIVLNGLEDRLEAYMHEANSLLNSLTFTGVFIDYIDLDPYGSPIPFIDSAVKPLAKKALLGVTATDTGPLTCSHPKKMLRRYGVRCTDVDFSKELGLRVLIHNLVFRASGQDVALYPILSYSYKYYYRVFFKTIRSSQACYELLEQCRGYIWYCRDNLARSYIREPGENPGIDCRDPVVLGPLWTCSIGDYRFTEEVVSGSYEDIYRDAVEFVKSIRSDYLVDTPYYRYDMLFGRFRKNMPPIREFIDRIRDHGYKAYRSHFDPRGVKTDAPYEVLVEAINAF